MGVEVGAWEPALPLGENHVEALDVAAEDLHAADAACLRQVVNARADDWARLCVGNESARLIGWLRALVLAEESVPGCKAGAKSPAIHIAQLLRERGDYPPDLTAWIRAVSTNRFLPYGSLMDRLRS